MGELGGRRCMLLCLELGRLVRMLLVLVKRLVLFSGSHGERCLPLTVMLLILILRRAAPRLNALYGAAQRRARKMALDAC